MKIKSKVFIALILVTHVAYSQVKEIAKKGIEASVTIVAIDDNNEPIKFGSGFLIDSEKVVTNYHVIEDCNQFFILTNKDTVTYKSQEILNIDDVNDIAILKVRSLPLMPLKLSADSNFEIGDDIYVIGSPKGLGGTLSQGLISSIRTYDGRKLLQISAAISSGSSGGPVLNSKGEVIGISVLTIKEGQNLNFAIPVQYLIKIKDNKLFSSEEFKQRIKAKKSITDFILEKGINSSKYESILYDTLKCFKVAASLPKKKFLFYKEEFDSLYIVQTADELVLSVEKEFPTPDSSAKIKRELIYELNEIKSYRNNLEFKKDKIIEEYIKTNTCFWLMKHKFKTINSKKLLTEVVRDFLLDKNMNVINPNFSEDTSDIVFYYDYEIEHH